MYTRKTLNEEIHPFILMVSILSSYLFFLAGRHQVQQVMRVNHFKDKLHLHFSDVVVCPPLISLYYTSTSDKTNEFFSVKEL